MSYQIKHKKYLVLGSVALFLVLNFVVYHKTEARREEPTEDNTGGTIVPLSPYSCSGFTSTNNRDYFVTTSLCSNSAPGGGYYSSAQGSYQPFFDNGDDHAEFYITSCIVDYVNYVGANCNTEYYSSWTYIRTGGGIQTLTAPVLSCPGARCSDMSIIVRSRLTQFVKGSIVGNFIRDPLSVPDPGDGDTYATVACVVSDISNGVRLAGANCSIASQSGVTNTDGYKAFDNVLLGTYILDVTKPGYNDYFGSYVIGGNTDLPVSLTPGRSGGGGNPTTCQDPNANNFGGPLPCTYNPIPGCVSNGSCSAPSPSCGHTTTGINNCRGFCSRTGGACQANGACGDRNTTYPAGTRSYPAGSTYCAIGSSDSSPAFPPKGSSVSWICLGSNGGGNVQCTASVLMPIHTVTVSSSFVGGKVRSQTPNTNINCVGTCASNYTEDSTVTLKAIPNSSYWKFNGWEGDCASFGTNPLCSLNIDTDKSVSVSFVLRIFNYKEF